MKGEDPDLDKTRGGACRMPRLKPELIVAKFARIARPIMREWMPANSCIAAARVVIETMEIFNLRAVAMPVCFAFQVPARKYARVAGFSAEERAEMESSAASWQDDLTRGPGWNGHLIVLVEGRWLLDPSLDQAASPEFGVDVPAEVFVIDTKGHSWNPGETFEAECKFVLDSGDTGSLMYRSTHDVSYLETEAWTDEGLPLLACSIASQMSVSTMEVKV